MLAAATTIREATSANVRAYNLVAGFIYLCPCTRQFLAGGYPDATAEGILFYSQTPTRPPSLVFLLWPRLKAHDEAEQGKHMAKLVRIIEEPTGNWVSLLSMKATANYFSKWFRKYVSHIASCTLC